MVAFRVENFRCIQDSGWVDARDITVVVGKNESGKTSLLRGLWKFNAFGSEAYDLRREWPRGRRREMSEDCPVTTIRFAFTPEEISTLEEIAPILRGVTGAEAQRTYRGAYTYRFLPHTPEVPNPRSMFSVMAQAAGTAAGAVRQALFPQRARGEAPFAAMPAGLRAATLPAVDDSVRMALDAKTAELSANIPMRRAVTTVHEWLPTFIYMDDYKVFKGAVQLDQMQARRKAGKLTPEDRTILLIMEMAGLVLDDEVAKGNMVDREQRMLDMNDASQTLTDEIADRWSQKRYEVMFQADGQHFVTFVKDTDTSILVPLEERSKGFQWFFSFDMTFMYETRGRFHNAVLLLDEPGLHLHAAAQRDLVARLRAYAEQNQLIYSTHLPFMIDCDNLEGIRIAEEGGKAGTRVRNDWWTADRDARFALQAALTLAQEHALLTAPETLIVRDVADLWLLTALSALIEDTGHPGLDEALAVTPAGGAYRAACLGAFLADPDRHVLVLLDADRPADGAATLLHEDGAAGAHALAIEGVIGLGYPCALEDLFGEVYYLQQARAAYARELGGRTPVLPEGPPRPVAARLAVAFAALGLPAPNRARLARQVAKDLVHRSPEDLPAEIAPRAQALVAAINAVVQRWRGSHG